MKIYMFVVSTMHVTTDSDSFHFNSLTVSVEFEEDVVHT